MANDHLLRRVRSLDDLELAALLSLVAGEHCHISTQARSVDQLGAELCVIARHTFGLVPTVVACHAHIGIDGFANGLILQPSHPPSPTWTRRSLSPYRLKSDVPKAAAAVTASSPCLFGQSASSLGGCATAAPYSPGTAGHGSQQQLSVSSGVASHSAQPGQMANVIIAKNLDDAPKAVQIQALELLRTRRISTRQGIVTAPCPFLFIAVVGDDDDKDTHRDAQTRGESREGHGSLVWHLNDFLYVGHWHDADADGFPHLEDEGGDDPDNGGVRPMQRTTDEFEDDKLDDDDTVSTTSSESVVKRHVSSRGRRRSRSVTTTAQGSNTVSNRPLDGGRPRSGASKKKNDAPLFRESDIAYLTQLTKTVALDVDVLRYQMNIVSFLRMHRAVAPGCISPTATHHLENLAKSLAPLHGVDFVTPALVGLAARKVYRHRIRVVEPERERSMQWGSELAAVAAFLDGITAEYVIEDVLGTVAVPP